MPFDKPQKVTLSVYRLCNHARKPTVIRKQCLPILLIGRLHPAPQPAMLHNALMLDVNMHLIIFNVTHSTCKQLYGYDCIALSFLIRSKLNQKQTQKCALSPQYSFLEKNMPTLVVVVQPHTNSHKCIVKQCGRGMIVNEPARWIGVCLCVY